MHSASNLSSNISRNKVTDSDIVQYAAASAHNGATLFVQSSKNVPGVANNLDICKASGSTSLVFPVMENVSSKREVRLLKNREAARECRNKKKEYIKCLENRVAVLENQNRALIDELKLLKSLYSGLKVEKNN